MGQHCSFKSEEQGNKASQGFSFPDTESIFHNKGMKLCLQNLHDGFVEPTTDKAGNNIICKKFTMNEFFGT